MTAAIGLRDGKAENADSFLNYLIWLDAQTISAKRLKTVCGLLALNPTMDALRGKEFLLFSEGVRKKAAARIALGPA